MHRQITRFAASLSVLVGLFASVGCSADDGTASENDAEESALSGRSCFDYAYVTPNTHSTDGHAICLRKRPSGQYDVKCMDGRRATTWDYGVALRYCNVAKPTPPAPPPSPSATTTSPSTSTCRILRTFECWADTTDGVCIYDCGGSRRSVVASCTAPGKMPSCPPQP